MSEPTYASTEVKMNGSTVNILSRNRISQIAVVVRNLERAAHEWARLYGAGPFFCGQFHLERYQYRGRQTSCSTEVAFGYLNDMQIQLVTPCDDHPSIYREILDRSTGVDAFHHVLLLTDDMDEELERHRALGIALASYVEMPPGMRIAFFDTVAELGFLVEYFQMSAYFEDFFARVHVAHQKWDRKDPIRRHPLGT